MSAAVENTSEITFATVVKAVRGSFRYLLSKWKVLCICGIIGAMIGIVWVWVKKPKYEAALSFSTEEDRSGNVGSIAGLAAQFGLDIGSSSNVFAGDNILQLIKSRKIIWSALLDTVTIDGKQQSLLNFYLDILDPDRLLGKESAPKGVSFPDGQDPQTFSRVQDSVLLELTSSLTKTAISAERPDKKTGIFVVTCTSQNEVFCKLMVEELVKKVSDFYIENKTTHARQTVSILQKTADSLKSAFDAALQGRASLTDENVNPAFQSQVVPIQRKQADITVTSTAYGEVVKNLEIAKFNLLKATPLITVIDYPVLPLKNLKAGRFMTGIIFGFLFLCAGSVFFVDKKET